MLGYNNSIKKRAKVNFSFYKSLRLPLGKKVFFIGTPEYTNLGDSAIALAQMMFLEKCGYKKECIKEFTQTEYTNSSPLFQRYISKRHLICGIGGGNMGNLWYNEELFRYRFLDAFPNNPTVIFPQTVYFTKDEPGKKAIDDSFSHYENHKKLTLVAREKTSYATLKSLYNKPKILLTPDIVLSTHMEDYGVSVKKRAGALLVFRSDSERAMSDDSRAALVEYLDNQQIKFKETDMYADESVTNENRMELVRKKMQEFADSEFVITDRLHGMVFAAITGTPCIAFSNNHHKVKGTYDWISYLPYIKYVDDVEEAIQLMLSLLSMKDCKFDNAPLKPHFDLLAKEINDMVNR